jgi:AraC family transcriptional regulator, positive regulator of tynA and feaB
MTTGSESAGQASPYEVHRWSSDSYEPRAALAAWRQYFSDHFHEIEMEVRQGVGPFRVRNEQHALGNLIVNFTEAGGGRVMRTRAHIAASSKRDFVLFQPRTGLARFRIDGTALTVGPGECVLVDTGEPYELECPPGTTAIALNLPGEWLKRWLPRAEICPAQFDQSDSWNQALCAVVGSLHPASMEQVVFSGAALAESIATLIALAAGPEAQGGEPPLFDSLIGGLRASLHEPDLSPAKLAERHHISIRTLYYAFASAGTTFREELMRLRLERAGELLSTPGLSESPILEIATRCGFVDPSHFARRFRHHFGRSPLRFRRFANQGARCGNASSVRPSGRVTRT